MIGFLELDYHVRRPIRFASAGPHGTTRRSIGNLIPVNRGKGDGTKRAIAREQAAEAARRAQYIRHGLIGTQEAA